MSSAPLRVCFWATTFGPDSIALAWHLESQGGFDVRVDVGDPASVTREPSLRRRALRHPLLGKDAAGIAQLLQFRPDVVIIDNMTPTVPLGPAGLVLWHGYGWKGPNDVPEMAFAYITMAAQFGSPLRDGDRIRWACFGPQDYEHRTQVGRIHGNVASQIGAVSHDVLRVDRPRDLLAESYPLDVCGRRNVVLAPTWHYGGILGHWGAEEEMLDKLVGRARRHGANVIVRLHDKWRMLPEMIRIVEGLAARWDNVLLKYKNESPDGLADLQIADVLVTNMSSIANLYYATERPTIHVFPVRDETEPFTWRKVWLGKVKTKAKGSVREVWKLRPEDNGGLLARTQDQLLEQLDQALEDPSCCATRARSFLDKRMLGADGHAGDRAQALIEGLARAGRRE